MRRALGWAQPTPTLGPSSGTSTNRHVKKYPISTVQCKYNLASILWPMHVNKYVSRETLSYECSPWLEAWVGSRTASHHWINLTNFYPSIRFCPQFPLLCSNLGFRFMHTTVEGPVLWFRKNVVEAARTGEVNIL